MSHSVSHGLTTTLGDTIGLGRGRVSMRSFGGVVRRWRFFRGGLRVVAELSAFFVVFIPPGRVVESVASFFIPCFRRGDGV